jgi:uncharacterized membrane protein affecting hemolysin expression
MKWYRNASIKTKIMLSIALACVTVLVSFATFAWNDVRMMKQHLTRKTSTLADMLGTNCVTAILFQDPDVASEVLSSVRLEPSIEFACIFDNTGRIFARYGEAIGPPPTVTLPIPRNGILSDGDGGIDVIKPIWHNEQQIGALMLQVGRSQLNQQLWQYAYIFAAILTFTMTVTIATASLIHKQIASPDYSCVLMIACLVANF